MDQEGCREVVTCLDSGHILKVRHRVYPDMEYERKQAVRDDYRVLA